VSKWGVDKIPEESTHRVEVPGNSRYFSELYTSGSENWPIFCKILVQLLEDPQVLKVWYQSDESAAEGVFLEANWKRLETISEAWMLLPENRGLWKSLQTNRREQ